MNENINLTRVLEGCKGMFLYCTVYGDVVFENIVIGDAYPIRCKLLSGSVSEICITKEGKLLNSYDGECILFPSRGQRDWSKFVKPIPIDTPMMCSNSPRIDSFRVRFYGGYSQYECIKDVPHKCFKDGLKSINFGGTIHYDHWKYIIPFDKFNPNDIEASLEYNIQK